MSGRTYETIIATVKVAHESIGPCAGVCGGPPPFDIPVSQLLRIERDRGFEYGAGKDTRYKVTDLLYCANHRNFPENGAHIRGHGFNGRAKAAIRPSASQRFFSAQSEKQKPAPARKPPPSPPRKPTVPSANRSALVPPPEDLLARISPFATTGQEIIRQDENEQERARTQDAKVFKRSRIFHGKVNFIYREFEKEFDPDIELPDPKQVINEAIQEARDNATKDIENAYEAIRHKLADLKKDLGDLAAYVSTFPEQIRSARAAAAAQGRRDFRWELHLRNSGLGAIVRGADQAESNEQNLRIGLADLKYNVDHSNWLREKVVYLLEEVIEVGRELKAVGDFHHQTGALLHDLEDHTVRLVRKLTNLDSYLASNYRSIPWRQLQRYSQMLTPLYTAGFEFNYGTSGHLWRKTDYHALIASRFPQLNDHASVWLEAVMITNSVKNVSHEIMTLLRYNSASSKAGGNKILWLKLRRRQVEHSQVINSIGDEYMRLLSEGLIMLNPALASPRGQLKYAALRPISAYVESASATENSIRHVIERFRPDDAQSGKAPPLPLWQQSLVKKLNLVLEKFKEDERGLLTNIAELSYILSAGVLVDYHHQFLRSEFSRMAEQARISVQQTKAFEKLSLANLGHEQSSRARLLDPTRMRGRADCYPLGAAYPIEYVTTHSRIVEVFNEMMLSKVLGIDLIRDGDSPIPAYVSIASTERVVVIEATRSALFSSHHSVGYKTLFAQLLEDSDVIKVFFNAQILESFAIGRTLNMRSSISLDNGSGDKPSHLTNRPTSDGDWSPPLIHHARGKDLPRFLTDLAFLPSYNLLTLLNAVDPSSLSSIRPSLRANLFEAQQQLRRKLASTNQSSLELGPVQWDHRTVSSDLMNKVRNAAEPGKSLAVVTREAATRVLVRSRSDLAGGSTTKRRDGLAAYYMYTTFAEGVPKIGALLCMDDPATEILRAAKQMRLVLQPKDREILQLAAKASPRLSKDAASGSTTVGTGHSVEQAHARALRTRQRTKVSEGPKRHGVRSELASLRWPERDLKANRKTKTTVVRRFISKSVNSLGSTESVRPNASRTAQAGKTPIPAEVDSGSVAEKGFFAKGLDSVRQAMFSPIATTSSEPNRKATTNSEFGSAGTGPEISQSPSPSRARGPRAARKVPRKMSAEGVPTQRTRSNQKQEVEVGSGDGSHSSSLDSLPSARTARSEEGKAVKRVKRGNSAGKTSTRLGTSGSSIWRGRVSESGLIKFRKSSGKSQKVEQA